jgi:RNA polymerase sigma factor (sigma-70 family)
MTTGPACDGFRGQGALISVERAWTSKLDPDFPLTISAARQLRQVLVARFGVDAGADAYQEAMANAWEHRDRLNEMANAVGYLYRVAQSANRRQRRSARRVVLPPVPEDRLPEIEPGLPDALARLSPRQRVAVLLVHAHGWTQVEAATVLDIDVSTLRNHLRRGLEQLRASLGVDDA